MASLLATEPLQAILGSRFLILRMRVLETTAEMRERQWDGADAYFHRFAQRSAGLPFLVFLDGQGQTLATSLRPGDRGIGYPTEPEELDWFVHMLATAAPDSTALQRRNAREACRLLYRLVR